MCLQQPNSILILYAYRFWPQYILIWALSSPLPDDKFYDYEKKTDSNQRRCFDQERQKGNRSY